MSKNAFDYIESNEKVLVNKGDLFMLMHTLVSYFACNKAPVEITYDCIQALCKRNMYTKQFVDEFIEFQGLMLEDSTSEELKKRIDNMEDSIKDVYNWLNEEEGENDEEEKKQNN